MTKKFRVSRLYSAFKLTCFNAVVSRDAGSLFFVSWSDKLRFVPTTKINSTTAILFGLLTN